MKNYKDIKGWGDLKEIRIISELDVIGVMSDSIEKMPPLRRQ